MFITINFLKRPVSIHILDYVLWLVVIVYLRCESDIGNHLTGNACLIHDSHLSRSFSLSLSLLFSLSHTQRSRNCWVNKLYDIWFNSVVWRCQFSEVTSNMLPLVYICSFLRYIHHRRGQACVMCNITLAWKCNCSIEHINSVSS